MKLLDDYAALQKQIFDYFGYVEDWRVIPIEDSRAYFWKLQQLPDGSGSVGFADSLRELQEESGNYYQDEIYTQRFLPKWVYRGEDFTMVCVDTQTDGNHFLRIFDNSKEVKNEN